MRMNDGLEIIIKILNPPNKNKKVSLDGHFSGDSFMLKRFML